MTIKYTPQLERWLAYYQDAHGQDCHFVIDNTHDFPDIIKMIRHVKGKGIVIVDYPEDLQDIKKLYNACNLITMKAANE